ncbi:MAG TPA: hypothetical protein ENN66_11550 [Proteobacteria bacterium]|nr:hypothetical protein [Pseudomonadota bacterium]
MSGALLHVWNHGLFKALLFFNAGAIIHAGHTRDLEQMGGAKKMPVSAALFLVGALAICALPPLNGFVGEWFIYLGLFKTLATKTPEASLALAGAGAVALATIGALAAVVTFVKLYGAIFLGVPRSSASAAAHDPEISMLAPMFLLAGGCFFIGLLPMAVSPLFEKAVRCWMPLLDPAQKLALLASPSGLASCNGISLIALLVAGAWYLRARKKKIVGSGPTWDCGYSQPAAKMQYTGTSFTQPLSKLFGFVLWPMIRFPALTFSPFPQKTEFQEVMPDTVLDRLVLPAFKMASRVVPKIYILQHGWTHIYVLYVLLMTLGLFIFGGVGGGL